MTCGMQKRHQRPETLSFTSPCKWTLTIPLSRADPFLHISMQMNLDHSSFESRPFPSYLHANEPWPFLFREHTLSFISPCKWTLTTPISRAPPFLISPCKWTLTTPISRAHPFLHISMQITLTTPISRAHPFLHISMQMNPDLFRGHILSFISPCKWTLTTPLSRAHPFLHISVQMNPDHSYFESTPFPSYLHANEPLPLLFRNHTLSTYANEPVTNLFWDHQFWNLLLQFSMY